MCAVNGRPMSLHYLISSNSSLVLIASVTFISDVSSLPLYIYLINYGILFKNKPSLFRNIISSFFKEV